MLCSFSFICFIQTNYCSCITAFPAKKIIKCLVNNCPEPDDAEKIPKILFVLTNLMYLRLESY